MDNQQSEISVNTERLRTTTDAVLTALMERVDDQRSDRVAHVWLYDDEGSCTRRTHAELSEEGLRWSHWYRRAGVREGDVVFIGLPIGWDYIGALLGSILLGACPCTVPLGSETRISSGAVNNTLSAYRTVAPRVYVTTEAVTTLLRGSDGIRDDAVLYVPPSERRVALKIGELPRVRPSAAHHLQLTSGSTAAPKLAVLSQEAVATNIDEVAKALNVNVLTDSGCCWLPMYHDMGLMQLLMVLRLRSEFVIQSASSFLRTPLRWLQRIQEHRITMAAAPVFAYTYCARRYRADAVSGLDLSCWRVAGIGAERVEHRVIREFVEIFEPHGFTADRFVNCYGMAESGFAVTVPTRPYSPVASEKVPTVGKPIGGMEICIRSVDDQDLPEGVAGELWMRGTSLMSGYYGGERHDFGTVSGEWFQTGDIGYYRSGELYIVGRLKELIILRGRNYLPQEFEECIAEDPEVGMHRAVAFGVYRERMGTEALIMMVEPRVHRNLETLHGSLQRRLRARFGFGAEELIFVRSGTIPRTTSHKAQRCLCRDLYLDGSMRENTERRDAAVKDLTEAVQGRGLSAHSPGDSLEGHVHIGTGAFRP